ncbi:hypothetical protein P9209_00160 [Prescottella defluvii]|nr:hypothetical protein P9209_00160 [Prescottella defluvii]
MTVEISSVDLTPSFPLESTENDENEQPQVTDGGADSEPTHEPDFAPESGNHEAAKYRRRLRETEAERDLLATQVEALQRAEILRLASPILAVPEDIFTIGEVSTTDLLDDVGKVDQEKVALAVESLIDRRPGLHADARRPYRAAHMNFGQGAAGYVGGGARSTSWQSALSGR